MISQKIGLDIAYESSSKDESKVLFLIKETIRTKYLSRFLRIIRNSITVYPDINLH